MSGDGQASAVLDREGAQGPLGIEVEVRSISKLYGGTRALDDISVRVSTGEIHALVGENGAGKSTLGKIIGGAVQPDQGEILVDGDPIVLRSPRDAIQAGVALIAQELALAPSLSVLDNIFLGVEHLRSGMLDRAAQRARLAPLADRIAFAVDPMAKVETLRLADQQKIEILRALVRNAKLIVMDEPTAALSRIEASHLLQVSRDLRDSGVTVIFISHFLDDVLEISDTVSVLKNGRHVKTVPAEHETVQSLVVSMLGRSMNLAFPDPAPVPAEAKPILAVRGLTRAPAFEDVSFDVRAGEIVGLAGLVGSGRSEIAQAIFGAAPSTGTVEVEGRPLRRNSIGDAIGSGVAMLPESRKDQGLVMIRSIGENVAMAHSQAVSGRWLLHKRRERQMVADILQQVGASVTNPSRPVSSLSGGNQQKVALAKWLLNRPRLFIADEPTRGVDLGAKRAIYDLLRNLAASGVGVLLISSELEELLGMAHRVLVVRTGRIVAEFSGDMLEEEAIMQAAFGSVATDAARADPTHSEET